MNVDNQTSTKNSIETLRAVAVILVFMHHLHSSNTLTIPYFGIAGGWMGVQIFFVISGYLIIQSALRYGAIDYIKHRVLRIYPAYLVWFVVFSFIFDNFQSSTIDLESLLIHLLFLQHFFPEAYFKYNALRVSWTLTIEVVWYVIAFLIATRFFKSPSKITVISVVIACIWVFGGTKWHPLTKNMEGSSVFFFVNNNAISQMPFFFFGAWIATNQPKYDKAGLMAIFLVTVVLFNSWGQAFPSPIFLTGFGFSALFLIIKNTEYENPKIIKILSDASYSFYLIHYPIIILTSQIFHNKYHKMFFAFFATMIVAYISYKVIEQPFMNMARKKKENSSGRNC